MKNRITFVAFLLCAIMMLSFGFAALNDNLSATADVDVSNIAAAKSFDADIYFSAGVAGNNQDVCEVIESTDDNKDTVKIHVYSLAEKDNTATFTLTIKNDSTEFDALIGLTIAKVDDGENFEVACTRDDGITPIGSDYVCSAGDTVDVVITITLKNSPQTDAGFNTAFRVALTASSQVKA